VKAQQIEKDRKEALRTSARLCRSISKSYAISVDRLGKLGWPEGDLDGDHLVCVVSEQVSEDYLAMLREKGISYIASCPPQKIRSQILAKA